MIRFYVQTEQNKTKQNETTRNKKQNNNEITIVSLAKIRRHSFVFQKHVLCAFSEREQNKQANKKRIIYNH